MATEKRLDLVDRAKIYELACAGCTRHGELPGECYHNEPCERLIFAFTVAEPVDAVEVVRCKNCRDCEMCYPEKRLDKEATQAWICNRYKRYCKPDDFCSYGEKREGE